LEEIQAQLKKTDLNLRFVSPKNIHLTLKFLGDIKTESIEKIAEAMIEAGSLFSPIPLFAKGVGVFPGIKKPRVLWAGISGQRDEMINLKSSLENRLDALGFLRDTRPFRMHLTIGRVKGRIDSLRLLKVMDRFRDFQSKMIVAEKMVFFRSELKPAGAVYTKLMEAEFSANE